MTIFSKSRKIYFKGYSILRLNVRSSILIVVVNFTVKSSVYPVVSKINSQQGENLVKKSGLSNGVEHRGLKTRRHILVFLLGPRNLSHNKDRLSQVPNDAYSLDRRSPHFSCLFTCEGNIEYTGYGSTEQREIKARVLP
jgi:hypothetical protein